MKALGVNQTEAILLHSRNYSETSLICELFTRKHGRVSVIAKGARSKKNKFQNIAAASILAKNYRDDLMKNLSLKYDKYSWESNFGYPTKMHRDSIKKYGVTRYHRKSFKLL